MNRFGDTRPCECACCPPEAPARGPVRQLSNTKVFNITAKSQGECLMHAQNILRDEGDDLGVAIGWWLEPLIVAISPPRQSEDDSDEWTMTLVVEI